MKNLYITIILFAGISKASQAQSKQVPKELQFTYRDDSKSEDNTKNNEKAQGGSYAKVPAKAKKEIKGDKLFFIYDYSQAVENYNSAESLTTNGKRNVAKSYFYMHDNQQSEQAYLKLMNSPGEVIPEDYYNYAMVLRSGSKYTESENWMDKYAVMKPDELRTKDYLENKSALPTLLTDKGKYKITHLDLNTDAEDFAPVFYKDKIVFASSRTTKLFPKTSYRTGKPYLNIYVADLKQQELKAPETFDETLNGSMNEGTASFSKDGKFMAFTQNNYNLTKKELIVNMEIYFRTFTTDKWSKPEPFPVNNKAYSVGHPSLSDDGKTMFFTSDMPGGFGGADIYKVTKTANGSWSKPENIGNCINTEGNEVFPFYEENKKTLFFSSDGHYGLGGLDLFSSTVNDNLFTRPINLGTPLNTSSDDFSLIVDSLATTGYFASNRDGGSGDDDIYRVNFLPVKTINGIAKDIENRPLVNTFVRLLGDNNAILDTFTTTDNGAFTFTVETQKNYVLSGKKPAYTDGNTPANTFGPELVVKADVILLIPAKVEEVVVEKINVEKPVAKTEHLQPIYFDLNRYNIRPDAKLVLDRVVKEMNENPNMKMNLKSYTDCRASRAYNQVLSNNRANASANYVKKRIVNPFRVIAKGYGETKLINGCACEGNVVSDCPEEAHQENRRTEFSISTLD